MSIDGRVKTNFDSESFGAPISLQDALGYSCDTFFYVPAANEYYADEARIADGKKPHEYLQHTAAEFGVGRAPGHRPAGQRAGERLVRRSRDAPGALEGEQEVVLRGGAQAATRTSRTPPTAPT